MPAYYQVQDGDTLETIASKNNTDVNTIQQLNNITTTPPTGSYVQSEKDGAAPQPYALGPGSQYYQSEKNGTPPQPYVPGEGSRYYQSEKHGGFGEGTAPVPPMTAAQAQQYGYYAPGTVQPPAQPTGTYFQSEKGYEAGAGSPEQAAIQNTEAQFKSGQLPQAISSNTASQLTNPLTGKPYTAAELQAMGYTFNPASGNWELGGGGAGAGQFTPEMFSQIQSGIVQPGFQRIKASENYQGFLAQEAAFYNAKRWDPARKKFVPIRQLIREGKLNEKTGRFNPYHGANRGYAQAPTQGSGSAGGPTQNLAVKE